MKILYVASKFDYGNPERGFSYEHYNFYDTLTKMNNASNEVLYFPVDEILIKKGREKTNQDLLEMVFNKKPDLVFFILGDETIKKEVVKEITQKSRAITFNWFTDDHFNFDSYARYWAPLYHWIATTDFQAVKKYYKIGYKNVIKTQWACNHFLYQPQNLPKIYDVTFVGLPHGKRRKIIEKIKAAGINVKCWGKGWPAGRVSQEEMIRIFSQSKINLNFTSGSTVLWKSIASIFLRRDYKRSICLNHPKYWLSNLKAISSIFRKQIKGRNFEIPGCGSFLLTEYADQLEDYYKIGKEIVCFKNINDLIEKIKYYLKQEEERETIAQAGYQRTLRDHTFEKRFNEIFKIIGF